MLVPRSTKTKRYNFIFPLLTYSISWACDRAASWLWVYISGLGFRSVSQNCPCCIRRWPFHNRLFVHLLLKIRFNGKLLLIGFLRLQIQGIVSSRARYCRIMHSCESCSHCNHTSPHGLSWRTLRNNCSNACQETRWIQFSGSCTSVGLQHRCGLSHQQVSVNADSFTQRCVTWGKCRTVACWEPTNVISHCRKTISRHKCRKIVSWKGVHDVWHLPYFCRNRWRCRNLLARGYKFKLNLFDYVEAVNRRQLWPQCFLRQLIRRTNTCSQVTGKSICIEREGVGVHDISS